MVEYVSLIILDHGEVATRNVRQDVSVTRRKRYAEADNGGSL